MKLSVVRRPDGEPVHFVVHTEDITGRRQAAEALVESENRFRNLADSCPAMMWVTDEAGRFQFANKALRQFCGATLEQIDSRNWRLVIHPEDAPAYLAKFDRAVADHAALTAERRVQRADGEWRWLGTYAEPRFSAAGVFLGHIGLSSDITERRQAEQDLRGSEEKFRQLAEHIREVFWIMNPASNECLYVQPRLRTDLGKNAREHL